MYCMAHYTIMIIGPFKLVQKDQNKNRHTLSGLGCYTPDTIYIPPLIETRILLGCFLCFAFCDLRTFSKRLWRHIIITLYFSIRSTEKQHRHFPNVPTRLWNDLTENASLSNVVISIGTHTWNMSHYAVITGLHLHAVRCSWGSTVLSNRAADPSQIEQRSISVGLRCNWSDYWEAFC